MRTLNLFVNSLYIVTLMESCPSDTYTTSSYLYLHVSFFQLILYITYVSFFTEPKITEENPFNQHVIFTCIRSCQSRYTIQIKK